MSNKIIDLGLLVKEPLIFKDVQGDLYTIPGNISTKLYIKLTKLCEDIKTIKGEEEGFTKLQEIVVEILSLDKSKTIDVEFVKDRFDDLRYLQVIVNEMMKHISEITTDPNSNSPDSK